MILSFRKNLESRQPTDVQTLQGEKRELQIALEREETEKHELFMQVSNESSKQGTKIENLVIELRKRVENYASYFGKNSV